MHGEHVIALADMVIINSDWMINNKILCQSETKMYIFKNQIMILNWDKTCLQTKVQLQNSPLKYIQAALNYTLNVPGF